VFSVRRFLLMLAISNGAVAAATSMGCDDSREPHMNAGMSGSAGAAGMAGMPSTPDATPPPVDAGQPPMRTDAAVEPPPDASVTSDASLDASSDAAQDAGDPAMPATLADTGLYAPGSTTTLAEGVLWYTPRYELWSDGARKDRWLLLPQGAQIDTSDMDAWQFPVGTKIWKEFARDGRRLETRLIWKRDDGWYRMAFMWNEAQTEALATPDGADDVLGTDHDVPQRTACGECHDGQPDFVLGVSAIQLAHGNSGVTLQSLMTANRLSAPPTADLALPNTEEWDALGYLHANCGSCHNPSSLAWDKVDVDLQLRTSELASVTATRSYQSTVGVALTDTESALAVRIAPGDPEASGIILRMSTRGNETAMPPLASEHVDEAGIARVSGWIEDL
jgi:hypothetical protein